MKRTIFEQCNRCARRHCRKKVKRNCKFYMKPVEGWKIEELIQNAK